MNLSLGSYSITTPDDTAPDQIEALKVQLVESSLSEVSFDLLLKTVGSLELYTLFVAREAIQKYNQITT